MGKGEHSELEDEKKPSSTLKFNRTTLAKDEDWLPINECMLEKVVLSGQALDGNLMA
jgi:hypothetical protein